MLSDYTENEKIEKNICNMLEKILLDEEDNHSNGVQSTIDGTATRKNSFPANAFIRSDKKNFSNIDRNPNILTNRVYNDYESMYEVHRSRLHNHKKFLTIAPNNKQSSKYIPSIFGNDVNLFELNFQAGDNRGTVFSVNGVDAPESFVNQKFEILTLDVCQRFRGQFSNLIKNQTSSRVLQNLLNKADHFSITKIFWEILPEIDQLIIDAYGNYFCQKFYSYLHYEDKMAFLIQLRKNIINVSNSSVGTYPLQSIIEKLNTNEEMKIISEVFRNEFVFSQVCSNQHGVHVIEKIIGCFPEDMIIFIYEFVLNNFINLANQSTGLILVKKVIASARNPLFIQRIHFLIINNFNLLMQNPFGNYTIQVTFEFWSYESLIPIFKLFINKFTKHCLQKYSSNVVEKCLEKGGDELVNYFVDEIIKGNKVNVLIKNNYGNYVLQKALKLAKMNTKLSLVNCILQNLEKLGDKKLIIKWKHIVDSSLEQCYKDNMIYLNVSNFKTMSSD